MGAANDTVTVGLVLSNIGTNYATLSSYADPALVDRLSIERCALGTAASGLFVLKPVVKDLSSLPGGGLLIPPTPLFGFAQGSTCDEAASIIIKIFYTIIQLEISQYWELVEARRVIQS